MGKTLKVRVTFTDDDDYEHTLTSDPTTPITKPEDTTVWSADMLVVEYTGVSIGAATADLFSNIGGTGNLQIKSLWSHVPDKDLRLAFTDTFDDAEDHTLIVGDLTLEFPAGSSGEQSFKWTGVELGWEDGQTIAVSIVPTTPAEPVANTAATGQPTISGTPQVGQSLTAGTADIGDADGLDRVSYNYQWLAGDANIQHATARTYTPGVNDVGKTIRVKVSFTDDRGNAESLTSIATAAVLATVPTAPQGLTVEAGDQLRELDASWQAPSSNGGSAVTGYKVQWKEAADSWDTAADVSQTTVTGTTHTITGLTGGVEYAVRVMATNGAGDGLASTEAKGTPVAENNAATGLPSISGTAQVGEILTASTSNINDEDGLDNVSYRYQWLRNDGTDDADIVGGTGSTRTLVGRRPGPDHQRKGLVHRRPGQRGVPDQRRHRDGTGKSQHASRRTAHHQRHSTGGADARRGHLWHLGRGRDRKRVLRLPVDRGRIRHQRSHRLRPHPHGQRAGTDHPGPGDLHRRRR